VGRFIVGVHACWTTSGEIHRVGLRTGGFVEAYGISMTKVEYILILYRPGWWYWEFYTTYGNGFGYKTCWDPFTSGGS